MVIGIPQNLSIGSFARGATQAVRFLDKWPMVRKTIGFLGTPVLYDLNKEYGPERDESTKQKGGISYYLKRYFSWGIVVSALGFVGSMVYNRITASGDEENQQPGLVKSLINLGLKICTFGGVIGGVYSEFQKLNVLFKCGNDSQAIALGSGFLENIKLRNNQELANKTINSPLRFNDECDPEKPNEKKDILGLCEAPDNELKAIFIGPTGTGKTEAMDYIVGCHVKRNPNKYVVWNINGNEVAAKIKEEIDKQGSIADLLGSGGNATADIGEAYKAITQMGASKLLTSVLSAIKVEAKRAQKNGNRLIVQFDEIDKLLNLAKGDDKAMAAIAGALSDLWDCKDLDILFASNATLKDLLGIGDKYRTITDVEQSPIANLWGRMRNKVYTVSNPGFKTQSRIIATYLLSLPGRFKVSEEQLFDNDILSVIRDKDAKSREEDLTDYIYKNVYEGIAGNDKEKEVYGYLSGRDLMNSITKKLPSNNILVQGKLRADVKITTAMVKEEIFKATSPFRAALEAIQQGSKVVPANQPRGEMIIDDYIDSLIQLPDDLFVQNYNSNERVRLLVSQVLLQDASPRAVALREKMARLSQPRK